MIKLFEIKNKKVDKTRYRIVGKVQKNIKSK